MILVTGATGLVGSHLLYYLTLTYNNIIAVYRSEEKIANLKNVFSFYVKDNFSKLLSKIKWIQADITDIPSLENIFQNYTIKTVYHCAGYISFDPKKEKLMNEINIEGSANIANFCIDYNIDTLCYVSSIAALGEVENDEFTEEETPWNNELEHSGYAISKKNSEIEIWRASQENVNVIIVNPGIILGYGFDNGSGRLFSEVKKHMPFYTEGITGYIGVSDVAKAMIALSESSICNEQFILVSENKSFRAILNSIADSLNVQKPTIKISKFFTDILWIIDSVLSFTLSIKPILTKSIAKAAHEKRFYTSKKIENALQIKFEKIDDVIELICKEDKQINL